MYNGTMVSGWLGTGVVDLPRFGGTAVVARPRPGHIVIVGNELTRRSGVQQQA